MKAVFLRILSALPLLTVSSCFAQQQPTQLVYIEGKTQKADGSPVAGVQVRFSNGSSVVTNSSGHYFNVVPSSFSGSSTANRNGIDFSNNRAYSNASIRPCGVIRSSPPTSSG